MLACRFALTCRAQVTDAEIRAAMEEAKAAREAREAEALAAQRTKPASKRRRGKRGGAADAPAACADDSA